MNLESQVCNLELSKKLHELEVKQESLFKWYRCSPNTFKIAKYSKNKERIICSAFTASELLELLPNKHTNLYKTEEGYVFSIFGEPNTIEKNICNALAKMLIHLIENKIIEVK